MHTLLPLDDCLYALQPSIPHLTRSSLHRCFQRHDISRLPDAAGDNSCLDFEGCWFVHSVAMDNMDDVETVHPNVADFLQLVADLVALFDKLSAGMLENTVAFALSYITEIDTGKIDADYMNLRFEKFLKVLQSGDAQAKEVTLAELHRSFSSLSQEQQKFAEIFLRDIQRGDVQIDPSRTFREYLTDYQAAAKNQEVAAIVKHLGIDAGKLLALMNTSISEANLNEYGRFDDLKATIDKEKAKAYFEALERHALPAFKVNIKAASLLQRFILEDGFELEDPNHFS